MAKTMKWIILGLAICVSAGLTVKATAQAAVYGEFSASQFKGSPAGDFLYGGSVGFVAQAASFGTHVRLSGDVQGRFVNKSGEMVDSFTLGPRLAFPLGRLHGVTPYAALLVGFARYNSATQSGPTDSMLETNAGVTKQISKRFDVVAEYSWARYGAFLNEYDPQTFSAGAMFYFSR